MLYIPVVREMCPMSWCRRYEDIQVTIGNVAASGARVSQSPSPSSPRNMTNTEHVQESCWILTDRTDHTKRRIPPVNSSPTMQQVKPPLRFSKYFFPFYGKYVKTSVYWCVTCEDDWYSEIGIINSSPSHSSWVEIYRINPAANIWEMSCSVFYPLPSPGCL